MTSWLFQSSIATHLFLVFLLILAMSSVFNVLRVPISVARRTLIDFSFAVDCRLFVDSATLTFVIPPQMPVNLSQ